MIVVKMVPEFYRAFQEDYGMKLYEGEDAKDVKVEENPELHYDYVIAGINDSDDHRIIAVSNKSLEELTKIINDEYGQFDGSLSTWNDFATILLQEEKARMPKKLFPFIITTTGRP